MKRYLSTVFLCMAVGLLWAAQKKEVPPYKNASLPVEQRLNDLISRMTLEEKVGQLRCTLAWNYYDILGDRNAKKGAKLKVVPSESFKKDIAEGQIGMLWATYRADPWTQKSLSNGLNPELAAMCGNALQRYVMENTRLGIPLFLAEEAPHGHMAIGATVFPTGFGMAATWSPQLIEQAGEVIAKEIRLQGGHISYGPVIDLAREPRWSRVEETFGEDPTLAGEMGAAMVRGLGGGDLSRPYSTLATLKHFIGYGTTEGGQNGGPTIAGERDLKENFLPPFRKAIQAGALSVMTSYNSLDGIPSTGSRPLLTDLLRRQWGFRGFVVSDLYSIDGMWHTHHVVNDVNEAGIMALKAGVDADLGANAFKNLAEDVRQGLVGEADVDRAVKRILRMKFEMGLFDNPYVDPKAARQVRSAENKQVALDVARAAVTLLKNKAPEAPPSAPEGATNEAPLSAPEGATNVFALSSNEAPSGAVGGAFPSGAVGGASGASSTSPRYTVFSLWDTYRNVSQLMTLLYPDKQLGMVRSMIDMYKEWGWMPKWELYGRETWTMEGDPSIPVIADTWLKGLRDFDIETAYEAFLKSATLPSKDNLMRPDNDPYLERGYVPMGFYAADMSGDNSVSHALEYYIADYALSQLASSLGKKADAKRFYNQSLGYRHYYSKEYGTLRPRQMDGSFLTPFDPKAGADFSNAPGFHEGSAWNYTFYVPHDIPGLARLMGGRKKVVEKLQMVFDQGLYDPANEPDIAYPYLFNYFPGEEWRTQKIVSDLIGRHFSDKPDGIPGNDDCGTMSAWLIFSMMGIYPDCPGSPHYSITVPTFDRVTLHLDPRYYPNGDIVIEKTGSGSIKAINLQGKPFNRFRITHDQLVSGKTLQLQLR